MARQNDFKERSITDINEQLKQIICEVATRDIDISEITENTVLTMDLAFDSVQIISLIVELESKFDIEIEDDDLDIEKLTVYQNLSDMIKRKILITEDSL